MRAHTHTHTYKQQFHSRTQNFMVLIDNIDIYTLAPSIIHTHTQRTFPFTQNNM